MLRVVLPLFVFGPVPLLALPACEPWGRPSAGGDTGSPPRDEAVVLSPALLDMGSMQVGVDAPLERRFTIQNVGAEPRTVHGFDEAVWLAGPETEAFRVAADEPVMSLGPGETRELVVSFDPPGDGDWVSEIRLNYGLEVLRLRGSGRASTLVARVDEVPSTPVGCARRFDVRIDNAGREPLVLETPTVVGGTDFSLAAPLEGLSVAPGQGFGLAMRFAPGWQVPSDTTRTARLRLPTNDPAQGTVELPLEGFAWAGSEVVESFRFHPRSQVDLLFVADTDGIMSAQVDKAQAALGPMLAALDAANVSLHAAVVTGASACPVTSPAWVDARTTGWQREQRLSDGFDGTSGPGADTLLEHAVAALAQDTSGGCLEGFRRAGAALHVVVIAGGPDGGSLTADAALEALDAAHPEARESVVSAVIATESTGCGGAAYGAGYAEAALRSGGEIVDLCAVDWSQGFEAVASRSHVGVDGGLSLPVEPAVLLDSVDVTVDGAAWEAWEWDDDATALVFPAATAPLPGSDVEVRYRLGVGCD